MNPAIVVLVVVVVAAVIAFIIKRMQCQVKNDIVIELERRKQ